MSQSKQIPHFFHLYGPVPSRRLGFSLGVDIIPPKTCSLNCIYCQLGPTSQKTIIRKERVPSSEVIPEIKQVIHSRQRIDYITFSGSGEPTLNSAIGKIIREIKNSSSIPVAVLTNSTLLTQKRTRMALQAADLVIPSLDAATQDVFLRINRPHPKLKIGEIIEGIKKFRQEFKGSLWLEVMLVKGINDSPTHIKKLKEVLEEINPDRIQLNTVVRPPAEKFARPLSLKELERIKQVIGQKCEIIAPFETKAQPATSENTREAIHSLIQRRPVTLTEIVSSLGKHPNEIIKHTNALLQEGKVKAVVHRGQRYYEAA